MYYSVINNVDKLHMKNKLQRQTVNTDFVQSFHYPFIDVVSAIYINSIKTYLRVCFILHLPILLFLFNFIFIYLYIPQFIFSSLSYAPDPRGTLIDMGKILFIIKLIAKRVGVIACNTLNTIHDWSISNSVPHTLQSYYEVRVEMLIVSVRLSDTSKQGMSGTCRLEVG